MKIRALIILILVTNITFGQEKEIEYSKHVRKYVLALWEGKDTVNNEKFKIKELDELKLFLNELSKRDNKIASKEFLTKPSENTLIGHYLNKKLKWNSFNGPHVGIKKLKNKKIVRKELKNLPNRNELLAHYYFSIWSDVLNKQKPMDLGTLNIDFDNLNLGNETERTILFLCFIRFVGLQVHAYSRTRFPNNCFRAKEYVENMPKFNGKFFYEYELPEFEDFKIEVDKRYPKMSFKEQYLSEFEKAKSGYKNCLENGKN